MLSLNEIIASNLAYFMARPGCPYPNANALGVACKISPNTVRNLLKPSKRPTISSKPVGAPTLDKLALIAGKLGCEVWELLHPDIQRSIDERDLYRRFISMAEQSSKR